MLDVLNLGAPRWLGWAIGIVAVALVLLVWSYARRGGRAGVRAFAFALEGLARESLRYQTDLSRIGTRVS